MKFTAVNGLIKYYYIIAFTTYLNKQMPNINSLNIINIYNQDKTFDSPSFLFFTSSLILMTGYKNQSFIKIKIPHLKGKKSKNIKLLGFSFL